MNFVFLGGTCAGSKWRDILIPSLDCSYFNPVVDEWNEAAYQREIEEREHDNYVLYVLTPEMKGFYSIAEVVEDSNKRPEKTIVCFHEMELSYWTPEQMKSVEATKRLLIKNGATVCETLQEVSVYINERWEEYMRQYLAESTGKLKSVNTLRVCNIGG